MWEPVDLHLDELYTLNPIKEDTPMWIALNDRTSVVAGYYKGEKFYNVNNVEIADADIYAWQYQMKPFHPQQDNPCPDTH